MFDHYIDPKKIYRYNADKKAYNIDISIDFYRDIYNEWDYSPIHNRELDGDLFEYLIDCSYEIPTKSKIIINFYLPKNMMNKERERKSVEGFRNYIGYSIRKQYTVRRHLIINTLFYSFSGFLLLIGAFLLKALFKEAFLQSIIPEGLSIGGWVLIWEIFSIIFFKFSGVNKDIKIYKRLADAEIIYHYI